MPWFFTLLLFTPYYVVCKKCFLFAEVRETRHWMQGASMATRWWLRAQTYFTWEYVSNRLFGNSLWMLKLKGSAGFKKRRGERGVNNNYKTILGNIDQKHSTRKSFPNYNPNFVNLLAVPLLTFLSWRKKDVWAGGGEAKRRVVWEVVRPLNNVSICQRQVSSSELSLMKVSCNIKSETQRFHDALIITC